MAADHDSGRPGQPHRHGQNGKFDEGTIEQGFVDGTSLYSVIARSDGARGRCTGSRGAGGGRSGVIRAAWATWYTTWTC
ncbi:hypothetical protein ACFXPQ_04920 [Streptomyces lydicus]|uniref:hypothetical protein n=1 Tax=Streptomyces lydicus TaxID=47763 RepID=UPI0036C4AC63